jgi:c-di-GMP-related signal transduction protein
LHGIGACIIAENIERSEEFAIAFAEGCDLAQGCQRGKSFTFSKNRDQVSPPYCLGILDKVGGFDCSLDEIAYWVARDSGLEARVLRAAHWTFNGSEVRSTHDALELIGKSGLSKVLMLAMSATTQRRLQEELVLAQSA